MQRQKIRHVCVDKIQTAHTDTHLKATVKVPACPPFKSLILQVKQKHVEDSVHVCACVGACAHACSPLYARGCMRLCIVVCVCEPCRTTAQTHDPEREMTACRLHEAGPVGGFGWSVQLQSQAIFMGHIRERDWRRRARQERSEETHTK